VVKVSMWEMVEDDAVGAVLATGADVFAVIP
jgi:hypothetical protein